MTTVADPAVRDWRDSGWGLTLLPMSDPGGKAAVKTARERRLAEALRANLRRRKTAPAGDRPSAPTTREEAQETDRSAPNRGSPEADRSP